jgi:malate dehydrogenase
MENTNNVQRLNLIRNQLATCTDAKPTPAAPVRVLVTGAAGNIGYALTFMMGQGYMFGPNQSMIIHLFDVPNAEGVLKGLAMELNDGAFDLIKGIVCTSDPAIGFKDIDFGIFCGARPRGPGMERKDLLEANSKIFEDQGKFVDKYAKKSVRVNISFLS